MTYALYSELTAWYHLVDPAPDHADEAACYEAAFARGIQGPARTLLDLGSGAGNNASHLKRRFACTLADLSPAMLDLSRARNPECEHVVGDLRTLRLGRTFDAVLLHDAVSYMTTEADLRAAIETAWVHTRPGGAAIVTADVLADSFAERTDPLDGDDGVRALRGVMWQWDPDPDDTTYRVDFAFLLRERGDVRLVHDSHVEGMFARSTWIRLLTETGFAVEGVPRPIDEHETDEIFLCRRGV
jgi:SAM-dependent methyltransferase